MTLLDSPTALFTADEFDRLAAAGVFAKRRLALVDGVIIEMHAQGEPHWLSLHRSARRLERLFGDAFVVRIMAPLRVSPHSQPEPDLLVYPGKDSDVLTQGRPTTGSLVVEISDTTLRDDRSEMARLYATARIPEYWIVNLPSRQLEVFRNPDPELRTYQSHQIFLPGTPLTPLALSHLTPTPLLDPTDLLP